MHKPRYHMKHNESSQNANFAVFPCALIKLYLDPCTDKFSQNITKTNSQQKLVLKISKLFSKKAVF